MSCLDAIEDEAQHEDELSRATEEVIQAEVGMQRDFLKSCRKCDANALVPWAPKVRVVGRIQCQDLHEIMQEALDYNAPDAPCMSEAMQLLLNVAYGKEPAEKHQVHARALIENMARNFARFNV